MRNFSEEEIQKIEKNIEADMNAEEEQLFEIETLSESITKRLLTEKHTREKFHGTTYIFSLSADKNSKKITVMQTDPVKFFIGNGYYHPAIATGDWDSDYTYEENVYAVVKALLCLKAGIVNVEELD